MRRLLSSPFFLIAAVAFFLPFFAVTCAGVENLPQVAAQPPEVTGFELATGTAEDELSETQSFVPTDEIPLPDIPGIPTPAIEIPTPEVTIPAPGTPTAFDLGLVQIYAIAAGGAVALGVFLSLIGKRFGGGVALLLGAGVVAVLFLMKTEFEDVVLDAVGPEAAGFIAVEPKIGFWGAVGGAGVAALLGLIRMFLPAGGGGRRGRAVGFGPEPGAAAAAAPAAAAPAAAETTETAQTPPPEPPPAEPPPPPPEEPPPPPPAEPPPPPPPSPPEDKPPEGSSPPEETKPPPPA